MIEKRFGKFVTLKDIHNLITNTHWIYISSKDCKPGTINVYNRIRSEVIAALVKCVLHFPDVQQQPNSSSCGLFALAYVSILCEGKDPTKMKYDFPCMRTHFLDCLQKKKFTAFPATIVPCMSQLNH